VRKLTQQGRVTVGYSADEIRARMVEDWLAARTERRDALMLASRRRDVQDLNRAARTALVERGEVHVDGIEIDGRVFAVGDSVMALSNRRRIDITNGDRGVITDINHARGEVTVHLDRGHVVTLSETYLRAGHLTYAYATTIHKAQGLTCDRALLLADASIFQEAGYTALTRGRERNQLYVVRSEEIDDNLARSPTRAPDELIDDLTNALSRSRTKRLAIDNLPQHEPTPLAPIRREGPHIDP
jgi:ATP-dependent exoDNAse (exonuclease V) alpha subunit